MKTKYTLFGTLVLLTGYCYAAPPEAFDQFAPPNYCLEGAVKVGSIFFSGTECDTNGCENYDYDKKNSGYDFLAAVSNKHLLRNGFNTIKGDGAYYLSRHDNIYFYDALGGYRGYDKSNFEGNAYKTYKMQDKNNHGNGLGWIWVMKNLSENIPMCSKKEVYFQNAPTVSTTKSQTVVPGRVSGMIYFSGIQDYYSKNAVEHLPIKYEVQRKVMAKWTGQFCDIVEEYNNWQTIRHLSPSSSISFDNIDCHVDYRIRSFDGTYYSSWSLKSAIHVPGYGGNTGGGSGGGYGGGSGGGGTCGPVSCNDEQ